jgi:HEAT repeat protein
MRCLRAAVVSWLAVVLLVGAAAASTRGIRVMTRDHKQLHLYDDYAALVIGVGHYDHWPNLPGALRDAREVAATLRRLGFRVRLVLDPDAARLAQEIKALPYTLGRKRDRALLIYYAGHGETESLAGGRKLGYLVPRDCPRLQQDPAGFATRAVSMADIEALARRLRCRHVLMVFDSCFSGSLFALVRAAPRYITEKVARPVRQFITAGSENEQVPDRSVFKELFLRAIQGDGDYDRDGYVTGTELGMYLQKKVVNYSNGTQHPQFGKIRDPNLDRGDFVFACAVPPGEPVPPPPPGEAGGAVPQVEFGDIEKWGRWQKAMRRAWAKARALEQKGEVDASAKAAAWGQVLQAFSTDNPLSREDEELRRQGRARLEYWRRQAKAEARRLAETKRRREQEARKKAQLPARLRELLQQLKDKNAVVRREAAWALGRLGDQRAVPALMQALKDKDWKVRKYAAWALGELGDRRAVPALSQALEDILFWPVREAVAMALGKLGDYGFSALLQALKYGSPNVRKTAAYALGRLGEPRAVPALMQALKDKDWNGREAAAEALGELGDKRAMPALIQALKEDWGWWVRESAAKALSKLGDPGRLALIQALKDEDENVRKAAAEALGELGDRRAVPALIQALKDEDGSVRGAAAWALGKLGDRRAVPALRQAVKDYNYAAAKALRKLGASP